MKKKPFKCLASHVLVAKPDLLDPNFFHSVVFIARHTPDEALGFLINRPSGMTVSDLVCPEHRRPHYDEIPVLWGGPVAQQALSIVSFRAPTRGNKVKAQLNRSESAIESDLWTPNVWVRAFRGYAGWGRGQLEREIKDGSWLVLPADRLYFDPRVSAGLWPFLVNGDDRWRALINYFPPNASYN